MLNTTYSPNISSTKVTNTIEADKRLRVVVKDDEEVIVVPIQSEQYKHLTNGCPCLIDQRHIQKEGDKWERHHKFDCGVPLLVAQRNVKIYSTQPVKVTSINLDGQGNAIITYKKVEGVKHLLRTDVEETTPSHGETIEDLLIKLNK